MPAMLILNPQAAKGKNNVCFDTVYRFFEENSIPFDRETTADVGHAEEIAKSAAEKGYNWIIAVGGDGTVNEVLNGILQSGKQVEFGIIPNGTCNDFIKAIEIPDDIDRACHIIKDGYSKACDVIRIGDRFSLNAAGVGFDVAVTLALKESTFLTGLPMYLSAVLRNLFRFKGMELEIEMEDEKFHKKAMMLTVANGKTFGGDFKIAPGADPADGLMDVILINDIPAHKRVQALINVMKGTHLRLPDVEFFLVRRITISSDSSMMFQIDGELKHFESNRITLELLPGCQKIFVPRSLLDE